MKYMIRNTLYGIGWGSTIFVIIGIISALISKDPLTITSEMFIKQAICAIICSVGFWLPSIVYGNDKLSRGFQVFIHMGIGISVYIIVGFYAGWIPVKNGVMAIIISIISMVTLSFAIWSGFYFYSKIEAKTINKKLKEIN